jgi:lipoprotein Spr
MLRYLLFLILIVLSFIAAPVGLLANTVWHNKSRSINADHKTIGCTANVAGANNKGWDTCPDDLLSFAQTLIGTPYLFASSNPAYGFDCSGFVGYVFRNFNIDVPRSSADYAGVGEKIKLTDAKPGDVILFTGTEKRSRKIGHIGIIMSNIDHEIKFIHSTSGKQHSVTVTAMDKNYRHRFVRVVRVLKQNMMPDHQALTASL